MQPARCLPLNIGFSFSSYPHMGCQHHRHCVIHRTQCAQASRTARMRARTSVYKATTHASLLSSRVRCDRAVGMAETFSGQPSGWAEEELLLRRALPQNGSLYYTILDPTRPASDINCPGYNSWSFRAHPPRQVNTQRGGGSPLCWLRVEPYAHGFTLGRLPSGRESSCRC